MPPTKPHITYREWRAARRPWDWIAFALEYAPLAVALTWDFLRDRMPPMLGFQCAWIITRRTPEYRAVRRACWKKYGPAVDPGWVLYQERETDNAR
jgi:hypothetical protein